jgi:cation diffusion facilitator CzcD-associated flavoprotein CzcO
VADMFDMRRDINFGTRVNKAEYDATDLTWTLTTEGGQVLSARYVVTALGFLTEPYVPDIPGGEQFAGDWYQTCRWPHDGVDFTGRRVSIIGTGATGVQAIPLIAEQAEHLTVFQRTPNYVVPAQNRPFTAEEAADLRRRHWEELDRAQNHIFGMPFNAGHGLTKDFKESQRQRIYEEGWAAGSFRFLFETFDDILVDAAANESAAEFIRSKIRQTVTDPATAELLCPKGYPYGGKRPPAGHGYYEAYNRPNVRLVDVSRSPLERFTAAGVVVNGIEYQADAIVLATGFDAVTGALTKIDVMGRDGARLSEKWAGGPSTYLGLSTNGFPNLFVISGPGSPFANLPVCIEKNVEWIGDAIAHLEANRLAGFEASTAAEQEWSQHVRDVADQTLLAPKDEVHAWFTGTNIPGKSQVINVYFGGANNYFALCEKVAADGYPGFEVTTGRRTADI